MWYDILKDTREPTDSYEERWEGAEPPRTTTTTNSEWKAVNNVLMYLWNESPQIAIMKIFDKDPANFQEENQHGYYDKFIDALAGGKNVAGVWSMVDSGKQSRLVELAKEKYGG